MTWTTTFREAFCRRFACPPESFEQLSLRRGLHRRALPIASVLEVGLAHYFDLERRTLRYLGNARSSEEFRAELDSYRSEYRRHGGLLRNWFGIRLSGRRLMDLVDALNSDLAPTPGSSRS